MPLFGWMASNDAIAQSYSPLSFDHAAPVNGANTSGGHRMHYTQMSAGMAVPFALPKGRLIAGLRYNRVVLGVGDGSALMIPESVHHIRLELILQQALTSKWQSILMASPGWASDFAQPIHAEDFNLSLALIFSRKWSNQLSTGLGASYVKDRAPIVLPVLQLSWKSKGAWEAEVIAPAAAHVWYVPRKLPQIGIAWRASFLPYNLGGKEVGNKEIGEGEMLFRRQVFSLGPALRLQVSNKVSLQIESGITLRNRLVFKTDHGTQAIDHDSGFYMWVGMVLAN